ncbi:MAG: GIY-YIG nuclease family protein [Nitrososphaerales archaeon]
MRVCKIPHIEGCGIYTLIIEVCKELEIKIGSLGYKKYPKGLYTYTGSALGPNKASLFNRISRHLHVKKRCFWHIDYLLNNNKYVKVKGIVYSKTNKPYECLINQKLMRKSLKLSQLKGFGASDCKQNCKTHLLYFANEKLNYLINFIRNSYESIDLNPNILLLQNYF